LKSGQRLVVVSEQFKQFSFLQSTTCSPHQRHGVVNQFGPLGFVVLFIALKHFQEEIFDVVSAKIKLNPLHEFFVLSEKS
jgi:hypothetical protein